MAHTAVFSPGPTYATTGDFANDGQWLDGPEAVSLSPRKYLMEEIEAPGVDGTIMKKFGYRSRRIELRVVYVAASADAIATLFESDTQAMANTASTLVIDGQTYYGCFLDSDATKIVGYTASGLSGAKIIAKAVIVTIATRLA